jgi:hypothetical protein
MRQHIKKFAKKCEKPLTSFAKYDISLTYRGLRTAKNVVCNQQIKQKNNFYISARNYPAIFLPIPAKGGVVFCFLPHCGTDSRKQAMHYEEE